MSGHLSFDALMVATSIAAMRSEGFISANSGRRIGTVRRGNERRNRKNFAAAVAIGGGW